MSKLNKKVRAAVIKTSSVFVGATTILSLSGLLYLAPVAIAATPSDYGLKEGNTISAAGSDDPDVYIVNDWGYKRLFLNPVIFGFYGHLGGFAAVKNISAATRDAFPTSGLFRVDGDEKVYGVETTGEDTGILHWVNVTGAEAVAQDANFFKKVFIINQNEFNWYTKGSNYASVNDVPSYVRTGTTTPVTGALTVALSPDTAAAKIITRNAQAYEVMKVRFSGTGTVNSLTFKRLGAGSVNDFANVYVYDGATRLTSGKSLSSSTNEVTFISLDVSVSGTKDLALVGAMSGTAGNTDYFQLSAVGASTTVTGTPINGNSVTFSAADSGGVTITKVGSLGNPTVGQKNAQLSELKIAANTEAASVKRITLLQGGTVKPGDIANAKLIAGTKEWTGSITSDGHFIFDLGSGYTIAKGGTALFKVWGDVGGKATETILLYFEETTDVWAVGDLFTYTMAVTNTALDTSAEAHQLTLQGGTLTIAFNGPSATTIGTTTDDTVLMRYSMTAQANIEVRRTKWVLCKDDTGNGTYEDANNGTNGWPDLNDFKVIDEDSGQAVMGPYDGTSFLVSNTDSCPNSATGAQKQFTDSFDLAAGKTKSFKVTADFAADDTDTIGLTSGDKVKIILNNYTEDTPDLAVMKYTDTNTSVADADIVPGADVVSNEFTLSAASLTLGLASTPATGTKVIGTKNVDVVGITFAAAQASDLKVTDITLTGYVRDETGTGTYQEGTDDTDIAVSVANAMSNIRLYEAESGLLIAGTDKISTNNLNVEDTGTIRFSFATAPWTITAGSTKTLLVRTDLSSNTASGTNGDFYSFDINATADVTALDSSSNTVYAGNADPNGATSPTRYLTVKNAGSMRLAAHADSPIKGGVYWGQNSVPISKFLLTATDEGFYLEKLAIAASDSDEYVDAAANVKQVRLTYTNKAGATLTKPTSFTSGASAAFGWSYSGTDPGGSDDLRPYVPKDGSLAVDVAADLRTKGEGATQDSNATVYFSLDLVDKYNASHTDAFRAIGDGSGTVLTGTSTNINDVLGAYDKYVYRVYPQIEQVTLASPYNLIGTPTVFKFSITAMGLSDSKLRFDNEAAGSGSIKFEVISSGQYTIGGTSTSFVIYDENNVTIDTGGSITHDAVPSYGASLTFDFTTKDVEITGGQTKTFRIEMTNPAENYAKTTTTGRAADYFQVTLRDDEAGLVNWVGDYNGSTNDLDTPSTTGVLRSLPLFGPTFQR